MSKRSVVNKKILSRKLSLLRDKCLSEHGTMMFGHMTTDYMVARAKEEILNGGDIWLACSLILLAGIKNEQEAERGSKNATR